MPPLPAPAVPPELPATGALVVGFSGGLDSTVLLHWLAADPALRARGLRALHVNHALHPAADAWQRHCVAVCERLQVPLRSVRVEVQRGAGSGLEAAAREARHAAFAAELAAGEVLVLAHHRADQAETFLLRALRASGPDGLAAMRPWRRYGAGWLWRPLLGCGRDALLAHARAHGLGWIDDPGNADPAFDRNFLRARVLPLLRERWPHADAALARAAALCGEAQALLEDGDAEALALAASADPHCLRVGPLRALPAPRRARALRRWIAALGLPPLPGHGAERIERELLCARIDAAAEFAWRGARILRWRGLLHADRPRPPLPGDWEADWDGAAPLPLPGGGALRLEGAARFDAPLRARARRGGERIALPGRAHRHALKHVLQALEVPPWERARLPLLFAADGALLAAGDLVYAAPFDAWLRARGARLRRTPGAAD